MKRALNILPQEDQALFSVCLATKEHISYVDEIIALIAVSAIERGTGRGKRTREEIIDKIGKGQAVIALTSEGVFVGFCFVESYEDGAYFANSALIVAHQFRGLGASRPIKMEAFRLGRKLFPKAIPITITTGGAVMKLNSELGYRPVTFAEITKDPKFWKGCEGCANFDILNRMKRKNCLCTAMKCDLPTKRRLRRVR